MYQVEIQSQLNLDTQRVRRIKREKKKKKVNNADLLLSPPPPFFMILVIVFLQVPSTPDGII